MILPECWLRGRQQLELEHDTNSPGEIYLRFGLDIVFSTGDLFCAPRFPHVLFLFFPDSEQQRLAFNINVDVEQHLENATSPSKLLSR